MLQNEEKIHSNFWLLINIKIFNLLQSKNDRNFLLIVNFAYKLSHNAPLISHNN